MNDRQKIAFGIIAAVIVGVGAFTYGALTAPRAPATHAVSISKPAPKKVSQVDKLKTERPTIIRVLTTAYPKITTDYTVADGQLYEQGEWYGTTLTYHGKDTMNRDTLRVLMQKINGVWKLRTTPPQPLLSAVTFPDAPKSVLESINQPVSLPGSDTSPTLNEDE